MRYLQLTDEEFEHASKSDITMRCLGREGYWDSDKFKMQMNNAVKIADIKYPKSDNWIIIWVFDHSSCHTAMAEDALNAERINVKPGGAQPVLFGKGKFKK